MRAQLAPMFPVITVSPFTKWGIDYTTCNPPSARGHRYIIVAIDYFTKWVKAMPTFKDDGETTSLFLFNQIIARSYRLVDCEGNALAEPRNGLYLKKYYS
jgi:hypothetical protein